MKCHDALSRSNFQDVTFIHCNNVVTTIVESSKSSLNSTFSLAKLSLPRIISLKRACV